MTRIAWCFVCAGSLAACATTSSPISRIDKHRDEYESWPLEVKEAVLDGRAEPGMTRRQVEVAMGEPSEVYYRGSDEVWVYREGGSGLPNLGGVRIGVGTSIGGVGVSSSVPVGQQQGGAYVPEREVVFRDGVVVSTSGG
ncbi:MAG: hypothetical protein D6781_02390 [Verrucomicrobia bacterium]|nr:MAG: hypothetical protein D6781_02390 [Verrucomicrobiota bacterium]